MVKYSSTAWVHGIRLIQLSFWFVNCGTRSTEEEHLPDILTFSPLDMYSVVGFQIQMGVLYLYILVTSIFFCTYPY